MRTRIHRLPDGLRNRLRERPRAISQMLELGTFYVQQPEVALALADRVVHEHLTLEAVRGLIRGYTRPEQRREAHREEVHNLRDAATSVHPVTIGNSQHSVARVDEGQHPLHRAASDVPRDIVMKPLPASSARLEVEQIPDQRSNPDGASDDFTQLHEAVVALEEIILL